MKLTFFLFCFLLAGAPGSSAQTYDELLAAIRAAKDPGRQNTGLSAHQSEVRVAWETGSLMDQYLLERSESASELVDQLASDLKDDPSRLYYTLQLARTYSNAPPSLDLHYGFYRYLLAVNDPRERNELAQRAFDEKWNWDKMRAEVKKANQDNKEFVFTALPGKPGVYRIMKAKRGPYRGNLVLDLGFAGYLRFEKSGFGEYDIVQANCAGPADCTFEHAPDGEKDLFTYPADVITVTDGDTFRAMVDLGFGITTLQTFRLWGLDAPDGNTKKGRQAKKALEEWLRDKPVIIRSMRMEKYGRYLADVWSYPAGKTEPVYVNQAMIDRGLAEKTERND